MAGRTSLVFFSELEQSRSVLVTDEVVLELLKLDGVVLEGQRPGCKTNVLLSYLIIYRNSNSTIRLLYPGYTVEKALKFVRSKRPIVNPNEGFLKQLKNFESQLEEQRQEEKIKIKIVLDKARIQKLKDIEMNKIKHFEDNKFFTPRPTDNHKFAVINTPRRHFDKFDRGSPSLFRNNGLGITHGLNHSVKNLHDLKNEFNQADYSEKRLILPTRGGLAFDYPNRMKEVRPSRRYNQDEQKLHKKTPISLSPENIIYVTKEEFDPSKCYEGYVVIRPNSRIAKEPLKRRKQNLDFEDLKDKYLLKVKTAETRIETPQFGRKR